MTARQIANALRNSGHFDLTTTLIKVGDQPDATSNQNRSILCGRDEVEVCVYDESGDPIPDETEDFRDEVLRVLGWSRWNGYRTGYGAWVAKYLVSVDASRTDAQTILNGFSDPMHY